MILLKMFLTDNNDTAKTSNVDGNIRDKNVA